MRAASFAPFGVTLALGLLSWRMALFPSRRVRRSSRARERNTRRPRELAPGISSSFEELAPGITPLVLSSRISRARSAERSAAGETLSEPISTSFSLPIAGFTEATGGFIKGNALRTRDRARKVRRERGASEVVDERGRRGDAISTGFIGGF